MRLADAKDIAPLTRNHLKRKFTATGGTRFDVSFSRTLIFNHVDYRTRQQLLCRLQRAVEKGVITRATRDEKPANRLFYRGCRLMQVGRGGHQLTRTRIAVGGNKREAACHCLEQCVAETLVHRGHGENIAPAHIGERILCEPWKQDMPVKAICKGDTAQISKLAALAQYDQASVWAYLPHLDKRPDEMPLAFLPMKPSRVQHHHIMCSPETVEGIVIE